MELNQYKQKRDEIVKHLYKSGYSLGMIARRFAIDINLVRDIIGLSRPIPIKEKVLRAIKHNGY